MADFLDAMLSGEPGEPYTVEHEAPVEQQEPQAEPVAEPAPEPAPEPTPEPEAPKDEQRTIPLATALNWRDEAKELKRRVEQFEAQQRQDPRPDAFDDPEGFIDERLARQRFAFSDRFARKEYGKEAVEAAVAWAQERAPTDPIFAASYMREEDPVEWIVQQHKRETLLSDIGDVNKLDDWFAREAAKRGYAAMTAPDAAAPLPVAVTQPAARPAPPPRSIASDRSAAPAPVSPEGERDGFLASILGK